MCTKVHISVSELLDKAGVTGIYLANKLKEGLEATKVIRVSMDKSKEIHNR